MRLKCVAKCMTTGNKYSRQRCPQATVGDTRKGVGDENGADDEDDDGMAFAGKAGTTATTDPKESIPAHKRAANKKGDACPAVWRPQAAST
jgi:hypothetical protein